MLFKPVEYGRLTARQKENFNFQKISAALADYGFATLRLTDDWNGADFLAVHIDGLTVLQVQLKGRLTFAKKYRGKNVWIGFPEAGRWFLYPHDELLDIALRSTSIQSTNSWEHKGLYSFPYLTEQMKTLLDRYAVSQ